MHPSPPGFFSEPPEDQKPHPVFLVATTLLVVLNTLIGYVEAFRHSHDVSYSIGSGTAAIMLPSIIVLVFSIFPRFRNSRSRTKIVFWVSIVILLSGLGRLAPQPQIQS